MNWQPGHVHYTLNNAGWFQPKFGSNMEKPKCWFKNVIQKCNIESESCESESFK